MSRVTFVGDVFLPEPISVEWAVPEFWIANLEAPITTHEVGAPAKVNLKTRANHLRASFGRLPAALCLANNHIMDYGERGFRDTLETLDESGIPYFGAGTLDEDCRNPLVIPIGTERLGLCGYVCRSTHAVFATHTNPGVRDIHLPAIQRDIRRARELGADRVVVHMHWGIEEIHLPKPDDRKIAKQILDMGADLIIGHHAHCLQPYEVYNRKHVFYGLGNCVFPDLDVPSFFTSEGVSTRNFVKRQQYWNRRSQGVEYELASGRIRVKALDFHGNTLRQTSDGVREGSLHMENSSTYEKRFRRTYTFGILRKKVFGYISNPVMPSPRHLKSLVNIARETQQAPDRSFEIPLERLDPWGRNVKITTENHEPRDLGWRDRLRYRTVAKAASAAEQIKRRISEPTARAFMARAQLPNASQEQRLAWLLLACRRAQSTQTRERLHQLLEPYLEGEAANIWRANQIGWDHYYGSFGRLNTQKALTTSLVLKAPQANGEKGVLYCSFEYNWMRLIANYDARAVLSDYLLIGASSWSPIDFAPLASLAGLSSDPSFIGISNLADVDAYRIMHPVVEPLPILASDWVDPDFYTPKPHREREIDILMVAHWGRFKRHWLLWEALRGMPRNLRVVLVGRNHPGRTDREMREEARSFGVRQDLEFVINVPAERVAELQCNARVSTNFSDREGSCVSVVESLFADSPVAMMHDAHVGAKRYINSKTGVLLHRKGIARQMSRFLEESERFSPREWAVRETGCHITSARLNSILRDYSVRAGLPWTQDIEPLCWRYVPTYLDPSAKERMAPAVDQLRTRHGVELQGFHSPPARTA